VHLRYRLVAATTGYMAITGLLIFLFPWAHRSVHGAGAMQGFLLSGFGPVLSIFTHVYVLGYAVTSAVVLPLVLLATSSTRHRFLVSSLAVASWWASGLVFVFMI